MTQSNDLPSRLNRAEDNIIDLRLAASALLQATDKNSADIAVLIEVSRRNSEVSRQNSEGLAILLESVRRNSEQIAVLRDSQAQMDETIQDLRSILASVNATLERMDRLFDYLMRRDQERSE